jgi:hypothetical protein
MDGAQIVTLTAALVLLLGVLVALLVALSGRRRVRAELAGSRAEIQALRDRLDRLSRAVADRSDVPPAEFVITDVGAPRPDPVPAVQQPMSSGQFVSVALGESLVRIFSFGYGVRRALSAENRNRIAFEVRREVRRSRKQRRRDLKEAKRTLRTEPAEAA